MGFWLTWAEISSELFWSTVVQRLSVCPSVCLSVCCLSICNLFTFFTCSPEPLVPISTKLCTKHIWMKGKWRALSFSKGSWLQNSEITFTKFRNLLYQKHWANFNQTWHKESLGWRFKFSFLLEPHPFPKRDNSEIVKIHYTSLKARRGLEVLQIRTIQLPNFKTIFLSKSMWW